ncbi:MAG TPA: DapH/DapD/GlmU-related protein [Flavitalea sp.]|nr:DapH/DapD/GlmU-related protein [Flavitalea sp.]
MKLFHFIARAEKLMPAEMKKWPWEITDNLETIILEMIKSFGNEYNITHALGIHKTAVIEQNVIIKGPVIIGQNVSIGANAYLRGPVLIDDGVHIGAACEIKQSIIFSDSAIAHFNYIGNSIIGSNVNFEAGAVAANHYNERFNKIISVLYGDEIINTGVKKFGSLVGDGCKIGANAVLSPGTILNKNYLVKRLELVEQVK